MWCEAQEGMCLAVLHLLLHDTMGGIGHAYECGWGGE